MSPEYWIWKTDGFEPKHAKHRFNGVAAHLLGLIPKDGALMAPIGPLITMIAILCAGSKLMGTTWAGS
jgi:hypothetical protein